jgi:hypothetical protein
MTTPILEITDLLAGYGSVRILVSKVKDEEVRGDVRSA